MIYHLLDRLFPKSFGLKIMAVAFLGTHVPLIVFIIYVLASSGLTGATQRAIAVILLATLVGTAVTLALIRALLTPVRQTVTALLRHDAQAQVSSLPDDYHDEIGFLMRAANRYMTRTEARLESYRDEAELDPLTGALNRRGFQRMLGENPQGWLIHFDIDDFKTINDRHGHAKGDAVLSSLSRRIRALLRDKDPFARVGGEEFVIFIAASQEEAMDIAERILSETSKAPLDGITLTVSIGMAPCNGPIAKALSKADNATYAAKHRGKNQIVVRS